MLFSFCRRVARVLSLLSQVWCMDFVELLEISEVFYSPVLLCTHSYCEGILDTGLKRKQKCCRVVYCANFF